jgi:hypothetical protein
MPLYVFENTDTGERFEEMMSWSSSVSFLESNPNIKRIPSAPRIVTGVGDHVKVDGGFQEVLQRTAAINPTSPLADRYGSKGIKEAKTREVVKKHIGSKAE